MQGAVAARKQCNKASRMVLSRILEIAYASRVAQRRCILNDHGSMFWVWTQKRAGCVNPPRPPASLILCPSVSAYLNGLPARVYTRRFARKLVATALQRRAPRMFSFGQHARIVMFAAAWFPVALRDALLYADYKLKRLERSRLGVTAAGVEKKAQ